jgi:hypothetical protein
MTRSNPYSESYLLSHLLGQDKNKKIAPEYLQIILFKTGTRNIAGFFMNKLLQ